MSYRTIAEYPLIISVGTAREEILQTFYQNRKQDYYTAAAISVIILLLGTLLMLAVHAKNEHCSRSRSANA